MGTKIGVLERKRKWKGGDGKKEWKNCRNWKRKNNKGKIGEALKEEKKKRKTTKGRDGSGRREKKGRERSVKEINKRSKEKEERGRDWWRQPRPLISLFLIPFLNIYIDFKNVKYGKLENRYSKIIVIIFTYDSRWETNEIINIMLGD